MYTFRQISLFGLLALAEAACGGGLVESESPKKDLSDAAKCGAAQARCASESKTLEESGACRARVRAICNDGGAP
jgi:hypothetical protein